MPLDRFSGRFTLDGRVRALTALAVGATRSAAPLGTDRSVARDALGRPFVPGSALKGALRAEVERLVRGVRPTRACNPAGADSERCVSLADWNALRSRAGAQQPREGASQSDYGAADALLAASCWICRLFGSPWLASRVQVADLTVDDAGWFRQFEVRDSAPTDRDTRTARASLRFDYEVVPAGVEFNCRLRADTDDPRLLGMLALGLRELEAGRLALGGGRSRGLGRVQLEVERRTLVRRDPDSLLAYIAAPDDAGAAVDDSTVRDWIAAFLDCVRADALPEESG
jgi:CRISPR-associated RAMP protein (TIGR02581 family)